MIYRLSSSVCNEETAGYIKVAMREKRRSLTQLRCAASHLQWRTDRRTNQQTELSVCSVWNLSECRWRHLVGGRFDRYKIVFVLLMKTKLKNTGCPKSHCAKVRAYCSACDYLIRKISSGMFQKIIVINVDRILPLYIFVFCSFKVS